MRFKKYLIIFLLILGFIFSNEPVHVFGKVDADSIKSPKVEMEVSQTKATQLAPYISLKRFATFGVLTFSVVCLLGVILIRILRKENIAVSFGSPWFRGLVLTSLSVFVLMVAFLGWYNLEQNKTHHLHEIEMTLRERLLVTQDRLNLWVKERVSYVSRLGKDPELVAIVRGLLQLDPSKTTFLESHALEAARVFFENNQEIFPSIGFFIMNKDHVNIGAMQDTKIGIQNHIFNQKPEVLRQAFQGKVGFEPPVISDVNLEKLSTSGKVRKPPTMFFLGPIRDMDGQILAVMALRIDPWQDFGRIIRTFNSLGSLESYAFDRNGIMLSNSRFEDQLRGIGLLEKGENSALNIEIRDPGGDMVQGYQPGSKRSEQPLTHMILSAIALQKKMENAGISSGHSPVVSNMAGYRDYRGVNVYGAWLWNASLDMGLTTEVDVDEGLAHFYHTRMLISTILGFTLFLSVCAILFVLIIGERTSKSLAQSRDNLEAIVTQRTSQLMDNQKQLAASEERSRLLLNSVGEGIFGVNFKGQVVFINPAANQLLGYEPEELIGQDLHEKIHHSYADNSPYPPEICPMFKSFTHGTSQTINDEMLWRKDGTGFLVEYTTTPILQDREITGAVITFRDISQRKQMEETLAEERRRLQRILDTSPVGVAFSTKGIIHFINPMFKKMFNVDVGDASPNLYVHPEERELLVSKLDANKKVENYEIKMYGINGEIRDMLVNYMPIEYEGEDGILGWLLDITDRKKAEQKIKDKFDELSRFRRLAVGREQKMIELKKELNELLIQLGRDPKYKIVG